MKVIKLYNGDSNVVLDELIEQGVQVDMVFTSPPYNLQISTVNNQYKERGQSKNQASKKYDHFADNLMPNDYFTFHSGIIEKLMKVSKIVLWNIQLSTGNREAVLRILGHFHKEIKDIIIWDKAQAAPSLNEGLLTKVSEYIIIFEGDGKLGRKISNYQFAKGTLRDIWKITPDKQIDTHGAAFPQKLVETAITNFCPEGGTVLDPFLGTGTTGVVAKSMGRGFIGIELSEEYFNYAKDRIDKTVSLPTLENFFL